MLHWEEYWNDSQFKKLAEEYRQLYIEGTRPDNDGFSTLNYNRQMYMLKCWMDDLYALMPELVGEEEFEKERVFNVLRFKKERNDE